MSILLPQQRLLLELIKMSGDIGVPEKDDGTILFRTLVEARNKGWITLNLFGAGINKAAITDLGRAAIKDGREAQLDFQGKNKRRAPRT